MKELKPGDIVILRFHFGNRSFSVSTKVSMTSKEMIIFKTNFCTPVLEFLLRPGQFTIDNFAIDIKNN